MTRSKHGATIPPATARKALTEPALVAKPIDDPAFVRPIALIPNADARCRVSRKRSSR